MKALAHKSYTEVSGLRVVEMPAPTPEPHEVVIEVAASSPNPIDWHLYRGDPPVLRLMNPQFKSPRIIGEDFAGKILTVGSAVTHYQPGDRVFGTLPAGKTASGAIAEQVVASTEHIAPLPESVPYSQAGAVGLAGLTALQALRDVGKLQPGNRVLIWGAAGGVGHLAVQIAKILGAGQVDAVCSERNVPLVKELGADTVYDYTKQESPVGPYDLIIDTVATANWKTVKSLLTSRQSAPGGRKSHGRLVTIGAVRTRGSLGALSRLAIRQVAGLVTGIGSHSLLTDVNSADLRKLASWMAQGRLRVSIEETYPLRRAPEALATLEKGKVRGKLVIQVADL